MQWKATLPFFPLRAHWKLKQWRHYPAKNSVETWCLQWASVPWKPIQTFSCFWRKIIFYENLLLPNGVNEHIALLGQSSLGSYCKKRHKIRGLKLPACNVKPTQWKNTSTNGGLQWKATLVFFKPKPLFEIDFRRRSATKCSVGNRCLNWPQYLETHSKHVLLL